MRPILLLPLALTLTLPAQEVPKPAPPAAPAPIHRGSIIGTVFCADTHAPARGATVMLSAVPGKSNANPGPLGERVTHVSVNGTYTFDHLPPGDYVVAALLQGYLSVFDDLTPDMMDPGSQDEVTRLFAARGVTSVPPDGSATSDIVLARGAAISGRVLYADGSPAVQLFIVAEDATPPAKAPVRELGFNPMIMMKTMFTRASFSTDDLGRFRLSGLKPGSYRLVVTQPSTSGGSRADDGMAMFGGLVGDPGGFHFYSGDTFHKKSARVITLTAGDEITGTDIRLPIDGFHSVTGLLTAVDGRPINTGSLTLTDTSDTSLTFAATPDMDGAFRFNSVPPGTYTLAAKDAQIGAQPAGTPAGVPVDQGLAPTNAFADASASLIVKETDLSGVSLTLTETPLSKPATPDPMH